MPLSPIYTAVKHGVVSFTHCFKVRLDFLITVYSDSLKVLYFVMEGSFGSFLIFFGNIL